MPETRQRFGRAFLWLVGGGAQGIAWIWAIGGAFFVSAFSFLLQAPLLFRIPLAIGLFFLSLAAISQLVSYLAARPRSVSAEDVPDHIGSAPDRAQVPPADASLRLYPPVRDDELSGTYFEKRTVYLADFARKASNLRYKHPTLQDLTFVECLVVGPAVVVDLNTGRMEGDSFPDCKWDDGHDSFWSPDFDLDQRFTGIVAIEDCLFRGCRFSGVGFLVRPPREEEDDEVIELEEAAGEPVDEEPTNQ